MNRIAILKVVAGKFRQLVQEIGSKLEALLLGSEMREGSPSLTFRVGRRTLLDKGSSKGLTVSVQAASSFVSTLGGGFRVESGVE